MWQRAGCSVTGPAPEEAGEAWAGGPAGELAASAELTVTYVVHVAAKCVLCFVC